MTEILSKNEENTIVIKELTPEQFEALVVLFGSPITSENFVNETNKQYREKGLIIQGTSYSYSVYSPNNYDKDLYTITFQKEA
ncbi:hypothetical protein GHI93_05635 [Lactococcus hircilactis]|uniref:Uncharacterized protein n=1 Tax=Lactococcus hircilactis TaxID=1494462 RepID=A0A7X1ZAC2_9LACT|nr:hypothetical protein [Lactococcus hircilactis]MQW39420.1 hypothetical protein [Lactococcus hircilactis]